ncbi:hypothetical protein C8Q79DRAFT_928828 [Trametes meyenii]|nr:hypothetical protein C8Q79DRAFT_928828 [Trametes meyenii]
MAAGWLSSALLAHLVRLTAHPVLGQMASNKSHFFLTKWPQINRDGSSPNGLKPIAIYMSQGQSLEVGLRSALCVELQSDVSQLGVTYITLIRVEPGGVPGWIVVQPEVRLENETTASPGGVWMEFWKSGPGWHGL